MPKPTVNIHTDAEQKPIPAGIAAMTQGANAEIKVETEDGRVLTLKQPHFIAQFRLTEALGDTAGNDRYYAMVSPLLYLHAINGDLVYPPRNKDEVEHLLQRLDEAGYTALFQGIKTHFAKDDKAAAQERATVKK